MRDKRTSLRICSGAQCSRDTSFRVLAGVWGARPARVRVHRARGPCMPRPLGQTGSPRCCAGRSRPPPSAPKLHHTSLTRQQPANMRKFARECSRERGTCASSYTCRVGEGGRRGGVTRAGRRERQLRMGHAPTSGVRMGVPSSSRSRMRFRNGQSLARSAVLLDAHVPPSRAAVYGHWAHMVVAGAALRPHDRDTCAAARCAIARPSVMAVRSG